MTRSDIQDLVKGVLMAHPQQISKDPEAMPAAAPLVYYAGHGVIWESKALNQDFGGWATVSAEAQPGEDAFVAAAALAAMDADTAGKVWRGIYVRSPSDSASRISLGNEIAQALKLASDQSATFAESATQWMHSRITAGTPRVDAYVMLKSRGLVAYNPAFEAPKSASNNVCLPADPNGGTWPHPNEPIPPKTGLCAMFSDNTKATQAPDALVQVAGAFGLGCEETILTTISFDASDRVTNVTSEKAMAECI